MHLMPAKDKKALEDERDSLSRDLSIKEREYEEMKGTLSLLCFLKGPFRGPIEEALTFFFELRQELAELEKHEQSLKEKDPTPAGLVETEQMLERASVEKSQA
eukprot:g15136.t1